ncbi:hypothetical protein N9F72_00935 [Gammaproteobacteria bacterium]|nr:hypothetical protein [Gammaproteobacteria bacterium]
MKQNINVTRRQGWITLVSLVIIAFAVSIGFTPLFELIGDGIASRIIGSSFGAIFVIILTMFLLNKQTEIEQESKKSERVFDEKVKIYQQILDITKDMLLDGKLTPEEINRLPFPLIRLQMLADDKVIESFQKVFDKLNDIYAAEDGDIVTIADEQRHEIYQLLSDFSGECRKDLQISEVPIDPSIKQQTATTISNSGKKAKDYSRYSFDGKELSKAAYVYTVIKNHVDENPDITLDQFPQKVIDRNFNGKRKNAFEVWKTYSEAIALHKENTKYKRYYVTKGGDYLSDKDMVIKLADSEICISNGWDLNGILDFIEHMKTIGIRTE